jgi:hypothetical protein
MIGLRRVVVFLLAPFFFAEAFFAVLRVFFMARC